MRVDEARGGQREQSQYPRGGARQGGVREPEDAVQRCAVLALGAQLLGEIGDGGGGARGEPAADQHQGGRLARAQFDQSFGGERVDGDADRAREVAEEFEGGLGVQAAERAGADVRDSGQRPAGDGDDQAVRGVGQQRVDLLGVGGVVEQEHRPADREGLAQPLAEVVGVGSGGADRPRAVSSSRAVASVGTGVPSGSVRRARSMPSG